MLSFSSSSRSQWIDGGIFSASSDLGALYMVKFLPYSDEVTELLLCEGGFL